MSSAHRLCAEVIAACRSVTQPGPRRAVLEIFGSRTLHRTGTEAPLTDRRGPLPEACRDVFCTPLAPAGGLLPIIGDMASNPLTPDQSVTAHPTPPPSIHACPICIQPRAYTLGSIRRDL